MMNSDNILTLAYLNIHGQSNLTDTKEMQIEDFMKFNKIDIAHLQEIEISDTSFSNCNFISSAFNIIPNNAANKYGTASLVKTEFTVENIKLDTAGRAIVFDIGDITLGNFYGHSGTDGRSRNNRNNFFSEVIPQLLTNKKQMGCIGGDWNCIIEKIDATNNPETKISNVLKRVIKTFNMSDSFRSLFPKNQIFSRYYQDSKSQGATRIDTQYHYGDITVLDARYLPLAFSDHHGLVIKISVPQSLGKLFCPRGRQSFRLRDEVIVDSAFQVSLAEAMRGWQSIKEFGLDTLSWWEQVVKPGIKKLGQARSKELLKVRRDELNLLIIRQAYLNKKVRNGQKQRLGELKTVHQLIQKWYEKEGKKIKDEARVQEFQESEKVTIYHHEIHKKLVKKSAILKLQTPTGLLEGHDKCATYLENEVKNLLLAEAGLDERAQEILLDETLPSFTEADNELLLAPPSVEDVKKTVDNSNLHAAPGTDGIPSFFYKECWDTMGVPLTEVMNQIFLCSPLTPSLKTSLMVFGTKPKKPNSILPKISGEFPYLTVTSKLRVVLKLAG